MFVVERIIWQQAPHRFRHKHETRRERDNLYINVYRKSSEEKKDKHAQKNARPCLKELIAH